MYVYMGKCGPDGENTKLNFSEDLYMRARKGETWKPTPRTALLLIVSRLFRLGYHLKLFSLATPACGFLSVFVCDLLAIRTNCKNDYD